MITNLSGLAASGWMEDESYERLHARATAALAGTDTFLLAVDGEGRQLLNTRVPYGTALSATSDPPSTQRALQTGEPQLSDRFFGQVAKQDVFNVVLPIHSNITQAKALILTRNVETLERVFKDSLPPQGWNFAVIDGSGKLVSGQAPHAGQVDLLGQLCVRDDGQPATVTRDGIEWAAASQKLASWGWRACVWSSSDQVEAQITERWRTFVMIVLAVVAASIAGGALLGRVLSGGIQRAARIGRALDAGQEAPEQHSMVREVDEVLGTLNRASRQRLQSEANLKLLQRETAHRAKNQIAIATALARLSARSATSVEELRDDISARLAALSRSIDMMAAQPASDVSFRQLVEVQLEPFVSGHPDRLVLDGDGVRISPTLAQSLGLVLHEKATNASKYGAWSAPDGRVNLSWLREGEDLVITWAEQGGPPPPEQRKSGFGSSLVEMLIERSLGGRVEREYRETGLVATFRLPKGAGESEV
jgi:two-component sensor histidine kinase